jgi:hypothetical protein
MCWSVFAVVPSLDRFSNSSGGTCAAFFQPKVKANASTAGSRNSISIRRSAMGFGCRGEKGRFKDWGGETSDLWTTKVRHKGRRVACAFAFKGPGTKGALVPGKLGKNGDQIQRLFQEDADIYLVQYVGQIAPSVMVNMAPFAQSKSLSTGRKICYGVVDGNDSARLIDAYPKAFRAGGKKGHS